MLAACGIDPHVAWMPPRSRAARHAHGPNALPEAPPRPLWRIFARQFKSPLIYILFVAAVLAVALGHHGDAGVILAVVLVNALIGSFQEGRAERSMAALRRLSALQVRVLRDGDEQVLAARELVPGDILLLAAGDAVAPMRGCSSRRSCRWPRPRSPANRCRWPRPWRRCPRPPAWPTATTWSTRAPTSRAGRARAVVVATGAHTEVGRIAGLTERAEEPKTPLELRLEQFGRALVVAALALFVAVVLLGLWRELPLAEVLMVAISQMVSMVPEGLPVAMTIALAVGMQRMAARGAIVRRLSAVETLGSTTVICSDKTGTLTRNEMTVDGAVAARRARARGRAASATRPRARCSRAAQPLPPPRDAGAARAAAGRRAVQRRAAAAARGRARRLGGARRSDRGRAAGAGAQGRPRPGALRQRAPREAELPFDSDTKLMATQPPAARRAAAAC